MKKLFLALTVVLGLTVLTAVGQHLIGAKVNGGLSYLLTEFESSPPQHETQKFYPMPSGQLGLFYNFHFKDKFLIGTEIIFIQIQGKDYLKLPFTDINGNLTGEYSEQNTWRHITYTGIPIYFGYSFKKLNINLGFQTNFVMASGGRDKGQATYNGQFYTWENKGDALNIKKYDYGVRPGLLYKLSDKFSVETNYYLGLTNLIKDSQLSSFWAWKVQQWTVGLRYKLFSRGLTHTHAERSL